LTRQLRVLITASPLVGHFWPVVPLGWALRAAGHDVRVACLPNIAPEVLAAGLPPLVTGEHLDLGPILENLDADGASRRTALVRLHARIAVPLVDSALNAVRAVPPDVVVHGAMDLAGPVLAGMLGVPTVSVPYGLPQRHAVAAGLRRGAVALGSRYGLPGLSGVPALTLDTCPPGLRPAAPAPDGPAPEPEKMRHVPYCGAGAVPDWVRQPPVGHRICVTATAEPPAPASVPQILDWAAAIAGDDVEVVVPVPDGASGPAPRGVRVVDWLPLPYLAPSCAAVVHCADPLALLAFLHSGVPQVLLPLGSPSRHADALHAAGAGLALAPDSPPAALGEAVRAVLADPATGKAAQDLSEQMRLAPGPATVVERIEALAG
jgi:UDP:flavonoid glycosyltransferase YjiC (YdhE family)